MLRLLSSIAERAAPPPTLGGHNWWDWLTQVFIPGLAALGVVGALVLSLVTFFRERGNRRGLAVLVQQRNTDAQGAATNVGTVSGTLPTITGSLTGDVTVTSAEGVVNPIRWRIIQDSRHRYRFENNSSSRSAVLTAAYDVTPGGDGAFQLLLNDEQMPADVPPLGTVPFSIEKSLASPAVTSVRLEWREKNSENVEAATFLI